MSRRAYLVGLGIVVAVAACGGETKSAPRTDDIVETTIVASSPPTTLNVSPPAPIATQSTTPPTTAPSTTPPTQPPATPSEQVLTDAGLRSQFAYFEGGGGTDPCHLRYEAQSGEEPYPSPYFGPETSRGQSGSYLIGWGPSWCIIGFELGTPIQVDIDAPDGTRSNFMLVLDGTAGCTFRCNLNTSLIPAGSLASTGELAAQTARRDGTEEVVGAQIASRLVPGMPVGRYVVSARQVDPGGAVIEATTEFTIRPAARPGVPIVDYSDPDQRVAFIVGHLATTEVRPALYRPDVTDCTVVDCAMAGAYSWTFLRLLDPTMTDERGEATFEVDIADLEPGFYCVVTAWTIIGPEAVTDMDPCAYHGEYPAGFWRR